MLRKLMPVLAACRRILLLLTLCVVSAGAWLYWHKPSLDTMRPELENILTQRLGLENLHLGHLSWHWAGYTWVQADGVSFTTRGKHIRATKANLVIRLSTWGLLTGRLNPGSINVHQGIIKLHISEQSNPNQWMPISSRLSMEDTTLILTYGALTTRLTHLNLHMDGPHHRLSIQLPGSNLDMTWNEAHEPTYLRVHFHDLNWLPTVWRKHIQGKFNGEIALQRKSGGQAWHLQASLSSTKGAYIAQASGQPRLAFNAIETKVNLYAKDGLSKVTRLVWKSFNWRAGTNELHMTGEWQNAMLHMQLASKSLYLPMLANWLKIVGNSTQQQWLAGINKGEVQQLKGEFTIPQSNPLQIPGISQWKQGHFHMHAQIHHATIPFTTPDEQLKNLQAEADIDEHGLRLQISHVTLPHHVGELHGSLAIDDWQHIVFAIEGAGDIDIARYQAWRGMDVSSSLLTWKKAMSTARFSLRWPLYATHPETGTADIIPDKIWQADIMGEPVLLSKGKLHWNTQGGIRLQSMHVEHDVFSGTLNLNLQESKQLGWQLTKLSLKSSSDFAKLVNHYRIPLDAPSGQMRALLTFDHSWRLNLDFHDAAWQHLLGSNKALGEPYVLSISGKRLASGIKITNIENHGVAPNIRGNGSVDSTRLRLRLRSIQAPAFTGSINIVSPFNDAPLKVNIHSEFLDRTALPDHIPSATQLTQMSGSSKAWVLQGFFRKLQWDAVSMQGVHVQFASSRQGIGLLQAKKLKAAQLSVSHVHAFFRLPGNGKVDIRQLSATLLGQKLQLSAILSPVSNGNLRWTGFADVSGEFSQVIGRLNASRLFKGGTVHALWSGEGLLNANRPWWNAMHGRLRLRSDNGRILVKDSTMTKLLAALNLLDLPRFLSGHRNDLSGDGMLYDHLQLEATVNGATAHIRQFALRASALDMAGSGNLSLETGNIDLYLTARPLQNLDAFLRKIPLLRDLILGSSNSVFRKVYHAYGPMYNAKIESVSPAEAGLPESGILERLLHLPGKLFGSEKPLQSTTP